MTNSGLPQTNIPDGIDLSEPHKGRAIFGVSGKGSQVTRYDEVAYEIHRDGTVTCDEGFEPVIEDGHIKTFRAVAA